MNFTDNVLSWIKNGDNEIVKRVVDLANYCNGVDAQGAVLLHHAAEYGNLEITRYLIKRNCNLNARNAKRQTPLMKSLEGRHYAVAQCLLEAGADVSCTLHVAVKCSDPKGVRLLLEYGADVKELNRRGETPLVYLYFRKDIDEECKRKNVEIFRILLSLGAPLMTLASKGYFQVAFVLLRGSPEAVRLVLQSDSIDFLAKDKFENKTILHYLAMNRDPGIAVELKPFIGRFDINAHNEVGQSPLFAAVARGNVHMIEFLLNQGAKVDLLCRDRGSTLLCSAFNNGDEGTAEQYEKSIELLLQHNVDPQATMHNNAGETLTIVDIARLTEGIDKLKLVIAQMAINEKRRIMLNEPTRSKIHADAESKVYLKRCKRLLKKRINRQVNIFKLLTASEKKMVKYLRKKDLVIKLLRLACKQDLKYNYKYYFNTLKKRVSKVILSKTLKDKAAVVISKLLEYRVDESNIITEKIIGFLNNQDLRQLGLAILC